MEHLEHENLPLCVLYMFSTYHGRTYLPHLLVLLPVFQIAMTQPHLKSFYIETPTLFPKRHWMTLYWVFTVLWHTISKYIFKRLDKQWCNCLPIYLMAYNIPPAFSIIAWHLIIKHHPVYINHKCLSYLSFLAKVFSYNPFWPDLNIFIIHCLGSTNQIILKQLSATSAASSRLLTCTNLSHHQGTKQCTEIILLFLLSGCCVFYNLHTIQ